MPAGPSGAIVASAFAMTVAGRTSQQSSILSRVHARAELIVLAALLAASLAALIRSQSFAPSAASGLIAGGGIALQALGVVLVYRANRLINFAQVQFGLVAASFFAAVVQRHAALSALQAVCPGCLPGSVIAAPAWMVGLEFWGAAALSIALAALLAWLSYVVLLRRLLAASRLAATVATIALAQLLAGFEGAIPRLLVSRDVFGQVQGSDVINSPVPFLGLSLKVEVQGVVFGTAQVLTLGVALAACAGLAAFVLLTRAGLSLRGSADNPDRARTLGVNVEGLNGLVWALAGLLSGLGGFLAATSGGLDTAAPLGVAALLPVLAAALAARFEGLPTAVLAAAALGLAELGSFKQFQSPDVYPGLLVLIVVLLLAVQPRDRSRAGRDADGAWLSAREARPVPAELARLPAVASARLWTGVVLAVAVLAFPLFAEPGQIQAASVLAVYALLGLSILVLTGWAGQVSLGQFGLAAVGAYVAAALAITWSVPLPLDLLAGALAGMAAALALGLPALRLRGLNLAVLTLALAVAVPSVLLNPAYLGGPVAGQVLQRPVVLGLDFSSEPVFYYLSILVLLIALGAVVSLRRARTGRVLIAAREDEQAARSLGVSVFRARLGAFAISGCLAGLAGGLLAFQERGVPTLSYSADAGAGVFLMAVVGGLGTPAGPILGALYFGLAQSLPAAIGTLFATGAGVLVVLMLAPGGLGHLASTARDAWLRRVALRHHLDVPSLQGFRGSGTGPAPILPSTGAALRPLTYRLGDD